MILLTDNELENLLYEDIPFGDLTTSSLGISDQRARMTFATREDSLVISCSEEAVKLCKMYGLDVERFVSSGTVVAPLTIFLEVQGAAGVIHRVWKTIQNLLDYASGIATYTEKLVKSAQAVHPNVIVATTRKTTPFSKKIAIKAVESGGGIAHRLGVSESILIFEYHRVFFPTDDLFVKAFHKLKKSNPEKKIVMEVENIQDALKFALMGTDVLQLEKFSPSLLRDAVATLRTKFPHIMLMATGGITLKNIQEYAKCEVDVIVTSSPYNASPADIKVRIEPL